MMAEQYPRATVTVVLGALSGYETLDAVAKIIAQAEIRAQQEAIENLRLSLDIQRGYYDDVNVTIQIVGSRPETNEEWALRVEKAKRDEKTHRSNMLRQAAPTKKDRKQLYDELRKEFEAE